MKITVCTVWKYVPVGAGFSRPKFAFNLTANNANNGNSVNSINNGGNWDFYAVLIPYFLVILLMIGGYIFFRKYLLKRLGSAKSGTHMKIIDRLIISQDKQIILIEMKSRVLVVGITQQKMETLAEFDKSEALAEYGEFKEFESFGNNDIDGDNKGYNKNNGFFGLLNEKIKTGFDKVNDKNKNEYENENANSDNNANSEK